MKKSLWEKNIYELIKRTSVDLPKDIQSALVRALKKEEKGSHAAWVLERAIESAKLSREKVLPICQDTGTLMFYCSVPVGFDTNSIKSRIRTAVSKATRNGLLRENTIDSITGLPYLTNIAQGAPIMHIKQGARKNVDIRLLMKGGGCENIGIQYSLPDKRLNADRDLDGVRKCILDAVWQAQGKGCAPTVLGVGIGGDRASGYAISKKQFLRKLFDKSPVKKIAQLETSVMNDINKMKIGPMGMGGNTTVLGVKIGAMSRLPASFFVSISFMCWAYRRRGVLLGPEGGIQRWL